MVVENWVLGPLSVVPRKSFESGILVSQGHWSTTMGLQVWNSGAALLDSSWFASGLPLVLSANSQNLIGDIHLSPRVLIPLVGSNGVGNPWVRKDVSILMTDGHRRKAGRNP